MSTSYDDTILTQCKTLAQTNDNTTGDEDTNVSTRCKGLHESSDDDENGSSGHAHTATSKVGERSTKEETGHDSSDGIGSVDGSDRIGIGVVEVGNPVLGALDGIED